MGYIVYENDICIVKIEHPNSISTKEAKENAIKLIQTTLPNYTRC